MVVRKLLIVEDDADTVKDYKFFISMLFPRKYRILKAYDVNTGLNVVRREDPDAIITDYDYGFGIGGENNGLWFAKQLGAPYKGKVVAITANIWIFRDNLQKVDLSADYFAGLLGKPYDLDELEDALNRIK